MALRTTRSFYLTIFAISGFSGLIYESIWTHYLKLFLGHAAYAQTVVLAVFMGGLAVGSALSGRYSARLANPLRTYAVAEAIIGVFALIFHWVFVWATDLVYSMLIPTLPSATTIVAAKWTLASLLVLPQSILLGTTFPFMTAGVIRAFPERPGGTLAALYFTNSLGGAIGVLASGFVLIGWLGLPGTMIVAGTINLLVALTILLVTRRTSTAPAIASKSGAQPLARSWQYGLLATAFATGAASFIYEIGWIRMLSLVLGSSTHSFELMLSAFILGLAFGGLWVRRHIDRLERPIRYLAFVQVAMGLCAMGTLVVYREMFPLMRWLVQTLPPTNTGYLLFNLSSHAIAMVVMLPATFLAGMTLPLITLVLFRSGAGESAVGTVYAANTLGSIVGTFLAVHFGLPYLGLKGLIVAGGSLDILVGLYLLYRMQAQTTAVQRWTTLAGSAAAVAACTLAVNLNPLELASGVFRSTATLGTGSLVLRHKDGKTASIDVLELPDGSISIRTNGKPDASLFVASTGVWRIDEPTMILSAAIPLSIKPDAKAVANIGFGSGLTTHVLLSSSRPERVDSIEIEGAMVDLARAFYPRNALAFSDPRSHIHIDDAKSFFSSQRRSYDIIISEPSNPWVSGVAGLFSTEFYALVRTHLAKGGIFAQWLQLYEIDPTLVASVLKALGRSFSDYEVYLLNYVDLLIVASKDEPLPSVTKQVFVDASVARELRRVGIKELADLSIRRIGTRRVVEPLIATAPVNANSDYWPVLDQGASKTRFLRTDAAVLREVGWATLPLLEMLDDRVMKERMVDGSQVTPVPHLLGSLLSDRAVYMLSRIKEDAHPELPPYVDNRLRRAADNLLNRCRVAGPAERQQVVQQLSAETAAFLQPAQGREFWARLQTWPCVANLPTHEKNWLDLARAISDRNADAMIALATPLAREMSGASPSRRFALAAAMLGHLALGRTDTAAALWDECRVEAYRGTPVDMTMRLLVAHAGLLVAHADPRPLPVRP